MKIIKANIYSENLFVFSLDKHMFELYYVITITTNTCSRGGFMRREYLTGVYGSYSRGRRAARVRYKRKLISWIVMAFIAFGIILFGSIHIFASSTDNRPFNKYYTSVRVQDGDTVWSIADRYIDDASVDKRDYVDEVCKLNNLTDGQIHSGDYIVVSYYSQDVK